MKMKRLKSILMVLMLCVAMSSKAQIFICDEDLEGYQRITDEEYQLVAPINALDTDQFTPIGNGWLLIGLGSVYLLKKRKKEN